MTLCLVVGVASRAIGRLPVMTAVRRGSSLGRKRSNDEMQRTSHGQTGGSPLISVFGGHGVVQLGVAGEGSLKHDGHDCSVTASQQAESSTASWLVRPATAFVFSLAVSVAPLLAL